MSNDKALQFNGRFCVVNILKSKKAILTEAHSSSYFVHPKSTKMYRDLPAIYWWANMKRKISKYVEECLKC